jgi:hypothetical protein
MLGSIVGTLVGPVTGLLDKVIEDKDQKNKLAHEIATMADKEAAKNALAQIELNTADAKGNWFQSSWRPLCGYVCVSGLAVNFLVSPIASGFGFMIPQADMGVMLPVLAGMLGLGTLRTFEKTKSASLKSGVLTERAK